MNFTSWIEAQTTSESTKRGYLSDIRQFEIWYEKENRTELNSDMITPADINRYKQFLIENLRAKPATINRHIAALRVYATWAIKTGKIASNFMDGFKQMKKAKLAPQSLSASDRRRLLGNATKSLNSAKTETARVLAQRDLTIVTMLLHTGLRVGELCNLQMDDVTITPRKGSVEVRKAKGDKSRTVPLNADVRASIQDWLAIRGDGPGLLFSSRKSEGISISGVHRRVKELGAGLTVEIHAHTLRHTFAKDLLDAGVPLDQVSNLLGHSNLETTKIYTAPRTVDLEKAVGRISIRE